MNPNRKLIIIQTVSPSYRNKIFSYLKEKFGDNFELFSGDNYFEESVKTDQSFIYRKKVINKFLFHRKLLFQFGVWSQLFKNDLIVLEMNPRIISNWIILIIRTLINKKTILWGHAWPRTGRDSKTDRVRNFMRSMGSAIIVYTKTQENELQERMSKKKIYAACNSVYSIDEMCMNDRKEELKNLIYVGRLTEQKKPLILIKAFESIVDFLPEETKLLIVGDGPEKEKLEKYIQDYKLENKVQLLGHVDDYQRLKEFYFSSFASISPGYIGLSVTQSFSFGVPMIVSRDENHSPEIEAVIENENSIFFETDNIKNLGDRILEIQKNMDYWFSKKELIVEKCKKEYSIETMAEAFLEAYKAT